MGSPMVQNYPALLFDTALLEPTLVQEEPAFMSTIGALEGLLMNPYFDKGRLLVDLMAQPFRLEFVFSALSGAGASVLSDYILQHFPSNVKEFPSSLSSSLLLSISTYFWRLSYPASGLEEDHKVVERALLALSALALRYFDHDHVGKSHGSLSNPKSRGSFPDPALLRSLGCGVPITKLDAEQSASHILLGQRFILERYLHILRDENLRDIFAKAYLQQERAPPSAIPSDPEIVAESPSTPPDGEDGLAPTHSSVEDIQVDLHNEGLRAFGGWRVFVSSRAERNLRSESRRSFQSFKIIMKKIRELSNGQFSPDNQKRLVGSDDGVPVYEARLPGDSRLIYHIHCARDPDNERDTQVLRIFGLYSHSQINKHLWDVVWKELSGRGSEYRKRCLLQIHPRSANDGITLPKSFPPLPPAEEEFAQPAFILPDSQLESNAQIVEMDEIMSKFFELSKAMLKSILVDEGGSYLFALESRQQDIIKFNSSCYVLGGAGTGKTITMMFKMCGRQRAWEARGLHRPRQVFLTQSRFLVEKVEDDFIKLSNSLAMAKRKSVEKPISGIFSHGDELLDLDEEEYWSNDLPKEFSALEEKHFPLFITYDHLCRLLEGDFAKDEAFIGRVGTRGNILDETADLSSDYMERRKAAFVSYDVFLSSYWAHFPEPLRKRLDPALVFAEFMGVIKGSKEAHQSPTSILSKGAYVALSVRTQAMFASHREIIYQLFEYYQKMKARREDYDAADRTVAILKALKKRLPGTPLDFVYVDEAQDNLLIDAPVIRSLSNNPKGFFWAGDTAQTISAGSSFRFDDLKAFLHQIETGSKLSSPREEPHLFHLDLNHRSHRGIVNSAHTVVEIIVKYWPYTIDTLGKEKGALDGPKPMFFRGGHTTFDHFFRGESARQCTIVRNETVRERLKRDMGAVGTILTIYESKGLEYDDVLLYNFFEDSPADTSQWRVVLNILGGEVPCPQIDYSRHNVICRELKALYVAVTRARQHLWIFDNSDQAGPMHFIWSNKHQIDTHLPGSPLPALSKVDSTDAWVEEGRKLFSKKQYAQAAQCFQRAGFNQQRDMAIAYDLRVKAQRHPMDRQSSKLRCSMFLDAANAFLRIAQSVRHKPYFRVAAECFAHGGDNTAAARAYEHASEYELCARFYLRAVEPDDVVRVLRAHPGSIPKAVADHLYSLVKIIYLKKKEPKKVVDLCNTKQEAAEFMGDYGFTADQAQVLEEVGNIAEAAQIHQEEGRVQEALRLFSIDQTDQESLITAYRCVLDGLWKSAPLGTPLEFIQQTSMVDDLLREAKRLGMTRMNDEIGDEVSMFIAIQSDDKHRLIQLADRFLNHHNNPTCCLRCLDNAFSTPALFLDMTTENASDLLRWFKVYTELLDAVTSSLDPCSEPSTLKMLAINMSSAEEFIVPKNSVILQTRFHPRNHTPSILRDLEGGLALSRWELQCLIRFALRRRMHFCIIAEDRACSKARAFQVCSQFVVFGVCPWKELCWHEHPKHFGPKSYNNLIQLHLQQILIYDTIYPFGAVNPADQAGQRRFWLRRLYHTINPPHPNLGSPLHLNPNSIPEFSSACRVVGGWASFLLFTLDKFSWPLTFMTFFLTFGGIGRSLNPHQQHHDFSRVPWVWSFKEDYILRAPNGPSVARDALSFMKGFDKDSLSRGMLLVRHILVRKVAVDVRILCDTLDELCGSHILTDRLQRSELHNITLPLSWWSRLTGTLWRLRWKDANIWGIYVSPLCALLIKIKEGDECRHLRIENGSLTKQDPRTVDNFVWRSCRNLWMLAEHFSHIPALREHIRSTLASLGGIPAYGITVNDTKSWGSLSAALLRSMLDPKRMDDMINIQFARATVFPPPRGVRRVFYNDLDELPRVIHSIQFSNPTTHLAESTPPPSTQLPPNDPLGQPPRIVGTQPDRTTQDIPDNGHNLQQDLDANIQSVIQSLDANSEEVPTAYTTYQIQQVIKIQSWCRKFLRGRNHNQKGNLFAKRARVFDLYLEASKKVEWSRRSRYRRMFLGPLAHIFLCLEWLRDYAARHKKEVKRGLLSATDQELEDVKKQIDSAALLNKKAEELHKRLQPSSEFHSHPNVQLLREAAVAVEQLISGVPTNITHQWKEDLQIGLKGIVAVPKRIRKPQLNPENLEY